MQSTFKDLLRVTVCDFLEFGRPSVVHLIVVVEDLLEGLGSGRARCSNLLQYTVEVLRYFNIVVRGFLQYVNRSHQPSVP